MHCAAAIPECTDSNARHTLGDVDVGEAAATSESSVSNARQLRIIEYGDGGEMKMALALYPVSMKQLMDIADTGNIMPPKTTWFEPKLRSGLVIHKLS